MFKALANALGQAALSILNLSAKSFIHSKAAQSSSSLNVSGICVLSDTFVAECNCFICFTMVDIL